MKIVQLDQKQPKILLWDDFKKQVEEDKDLGVLYRGHGNLEYKLKTTLARYLLNSNEFYSQVYHQKLLKIAQSNPTLADILVKVLGNSIEIERAARYS